MNDTTVITALESRLVAITTMQANREFVAELAGHEARINATIKSLNLKRDDCAKAVAPIIILRARAEAQLQRLIEAAREAGEFAQAGDNQHSTGGGSAAGPTSLGGVGLSKREADRARVLARAEAGDPTAIAKAAEKIVASGRAPTLEAVTEALRPKPAPEPAPAPAPAQPTESGGWQGDDDIESRLLTMTQQQRLNAFKVQFEKKLTTYLGAQYRKLADDEVAQKCAAWKADAFPHFEKLMDEAKEEIRKARRDQQTYCDLSAAHKMRMTPEQFMTVLRSVHPDNSASEETRNAAFRILNDLKYALTGENPPKKRRTR
jgi:hypothetical protein